jgi:ribulose-phosphate 3-epimerase
MHPGAIIDLEVDGGIDAKTAKAVIAAGADVLVAGSATFKGGKRRYAANIRGLRGVK